MSLSSEIHSALTADTTIKGVVSDSIFYQREPQNFDPAANSILFDYAITDTVANLDTITLFVICFAIDTVVLDALAGDVRKCLEAYSSTNMIGIEFSGEKQSYDTQKDRTVKIVQFTVFFDKD